MMVRNLSTLATRMVARVDGGAGLGRFAEIHLVGGDSLISKRERR